LEGEWLKLQPNLVHQHGKQVSKVAEHHFKGHIFTVGKIANVVHWWLFEALDVVVSCL